MVMDFLELLCTAHIMHLTICAHAGITTQVHEQSILSLPEVVTSDGFPVPPLLPNSSTPMNSTFQWIFPFLTLKADQNITGWLFQAADAKGCSRGQEELLAGMELENIPIFTLWDFVKEVSLLDTPDGVYSFYRRRELNSTAPSSIHKITGTSPSLYYYKVREAVEIRDRDILGIRGTNETLGIHFVNVDISPVLIPWTVMEGDDDMFSTASRVFTFNLDFVGPQAFPYLPLIAPVFGEQCKLLQNGRLYMYVCNII